MKNYEKVLIGVGTATVVAAAAVVCVRYQMVKEQEETAAARPLNRISATGEMVRSKLKGEDVKPECAGCTFVRRLLKALGIYGLVNNVQCKCGDVQKKFAKNA